MGEKKGKNCENGKKGKHLAKKKKMDKVTTRRTMESKYIKN